MKANFICIVAVLGGVLLAACQPKGGDANGVEAQADSVTVNGKIKDCDVKVGDVAFTKMVNGADTCVKVLDGGVLEFRGTQGRDYFNDPDGGKLSNNTLPVLLVPTDNTKPFTFTAKVTPGFTEYGLYNAADLFVYVNDTLWQKLAFEQDEYGNHRIVSVRTQGTSDDNNHQSIEKPYVYMRISSDGKQIGNYYSEDGKTWRLARLYANDYPEKVLLGLSSQSPKDNGHTCSFTDVSIVETAVSNFRIGKLVNE